MGQLDIKWLIHSNNWCPPGIMMRLAQEISFLSQWENSGGGRDGGDQRQVGVPVESGLGGPTQKSAPPCGTRGLGSIESSNDD